MVEAAKILEPWANFYILVGSAAAALTGLMFVVITLVKERVRELQPDGIHAFSTPTVVHFGAALFFAAVLSAPWHLLIHPAIVLGFSGVCGMVYMARVIKMQKNLRDYVPDFEDWAWYTILPFVAYGAAIAGSFMLAPMPVEGMFAFAVCVLLLVFIGIHNAWDIVTYLTISHARDGESQ